MQISINKAYNHKQSRAWLASLTLPSMLDVMQYWAYGHMMTPAYKLANPLLAWLCAASTCQAHFRAEICSCTDIRKMISCRLPRAQSNWYSLSLTYILCTTYCRVSGTNMRGRSCWVDMSGTSSRPTRMSKYHAQDMPAPSSPWPRPTLVLGRRVTSCHRAILLLSCLTGRPVVKF